MPGGRYWLMQFMDAWSNTVQDPSSANPQLAEQHSGPPYTYAITGPAFSGTLPENLTHLPLPTSSAWLIGRIQVNGEDDLPAVHTLQQQLKLMPLSAWTAGTPAPSSPTSRWAQICRETRCTPPSSTPPTMVASRAVSD